MSLDFLFLGGYGNFVWPAFIFTLISCFYLYFETKKELKENEIRFVKEFGQFSKTEITKVNKKYSREVTFGSTIL